MRIKNRKPLTVVERRDKAILDRLAKALALSDDEFLKHRPRLHYRRKKQAKKHKRKVRK